MTTTTHPYRPYEALYTYAYDGSGVALRCKVTVHPSMTMVHGRGHDLVYVTFHEYLPRLDGLSEHPDMNEDGRWVPATGSFTSIDTDAPLASFAWLD